jgi:hypothetical protein
MSNKLEFPQTVAACKAAEKSQWDIGDAIKDECGIGVSGRNDGSYDRIKEAAKEVAEHCGVTYTLSTLRKMRYVSSMFPGGTRVPLIPWKIHLIAGTPEKLQEIRDAAKTQDKKLTTGFVKQFKKKNLPPVPPQFKSLKKKIKPADYTSFDKIYHEQLEAMVAAEKTLPMVEDIAERLPDEGVNLSLGFCVEVINMWQQVAQVLRSQNRPGTTTPKLREVNLSKPKLVVVGDDDAA